MIPAFNEATTIEDVVRHASAFGTVVVVDDASEDGTAELARQAGAEIVRHQSNGGYDRALLSGFDWADSRGFGVVASLDADAQHDPALLEHLLQPLADGPAQLVLGVRPGPARLSERVFCRYSQARYGVPDILCGVKAFRMEVFRRHRQAMTRPSIGTGLALAALRDGASFDVLTVPIRPRPHGRSRFGSGLRPNLRIVRALLAAVAADAVTWKRRRSKAA